MGQSHPATLRRRVSGLAAYSVREIIPCPFLPDNGLVAPRVCVLRALSWVYLYCGRSASCGPGAEVLPIRLI